MKNNSGFSLVELIVVIAIMAILAGVAVPTYTKYVSKANDSKVIAQLDGIKTAALSAATMDGATISQIAIEDDDAIEAAEFGLGEHAKATNITKNFKDLMGSTTDVKVDLTGTSYENGVTWTSANGWVAQDN